MLKKITFSLCGVILLVLVAATIVEQNYGTEVAVNYFYTSPATLLLWAATVCCAVVYMFQCHLQKHLVTLLLHLSFVVILTGALTTHLFGQHGTLHLRFGTSATEFTIKNKGTQQFPFAVALDDFRLTYYAGTQSPMDFVSRLQIVDGSDTLCGIVSMNNVFTYRHYRFYQSTYDSDKQGATFAVNHDPYGIAITYTGYLMLLAGLILIMFSKHNRIRQLLRIAARPAMTMLVLCLCCGQAKAGELIDKEIADEMGQIAVLYNGRICPLNTAATDFVTKLCGKSTWQGISANEIFLSWTIFYSEWENRPIIKVKSREVQKILGIDGKWACVRDFYTSQNEYKLKDKISDVLLSESTRKAIRETDEKIQVVTMFYNSELLRIFPLSNNGVIEWHKPGSTELPHDVGEAEFQFINHAMDHLVMSILAQDVTRVRSIITKITLYQNEKAQGILPSAALMQAEIIYNKLQAAVWTVFVILTFSLLFCVISDLIWTRPL